MAKQHNHHINITQQLVHYFNIEKSTKQYIFRCALMPLYH